MTVDGSEVTPVCYLKPHPLDLRRSSWTLRPEAVTCPRCKIVIEARRP